MINKSQVTLYMSQQEQITITHTKKQGNGKILNMKSKEDRVTALNSSLSLVTVPFPIVRKATP